jgi:hypothetical protein
MASLTITRELSPAHRQIKPTNAVLHRLIATVKNPNLIVVAAFCAIGLLVTIGAMLSFSGFAAVMGQLG